MQHTKFADRFIKVPGQRELAYNPDCAQRVFAWSDYVGVMGRSAIMVHCPFCEGKTKAFVWSLPNGKRCNHCPAIFGRIDAYCLTSLFVRWHNGNAG